MKNILKVSVLSLLLMGLLTATAHAQTRYATVDLQKIFQNFYVTKQALASLKDRATELDKTRKEMVDSYQKTQDEYKKLLADANDQAVTSEERDKRKAAAAEKLKDLQGIENNVNSFDKQAQTTLDEQKRRLTDNIFTQIRKAVSDRARKDGYSLVLDTTTPIVVYSNGENDLTDLVLKELNVTAPLEMAPKAVETPAKK